MRLLRLQEGGGFSLTKDLVDNIPPYAILSHTWGDDDQEVTFRDIQHDTGQQKQGYQKLRFCVQQAASDDLQHFWVDTCCIDKSSSAELTEAINSMFRWYQNAAQCYVYLPDVSKDDCEESWKPALKESRWFTRGWTLQELIAPELVTFFSAEGQYLGNKVSLETLLHEITKIPVDVLQGRRLSEISIQDRFSWLGARQTKRAEDRAYSLFGIFNVHLPLLYGEGENNAFSRLKQEVGKQEIGEYSLFDTSLAALKKFQDEADHSLHGLIGSEIENLQQCRTALLRSVSPNKTAGDSNLSSSVLDLLTSIQKLSSRKTISNLFDSNFENQKSVEAEGHSTRITQFDSKSVRFREHIDRTAQLHLLTKLVRLLCSWLIPEAPRMGTEELTEEYLRESSEPDEFRMLEFQKIRTQITKEREADARRELNAWIQNGYVPNEVYDRFTPERLEEREDPYIAIRSWTLQTMETPQAFDVAYDAREADAVSGASRAKLIDLFQSIARSIAGCTFILDGLDECCWEDEMRHKRNYVTEFLTTLKRAVANTNTRILIASRNEPEIQQGLGLDDEQVYRYGITIDDVRSDIEKYSISIIEKSLSKKKVATKQELSMRLADRCEGQFLWLRMQENSLDSLMTERQLRKAIDTTPAQLDQVYDPNWKKILSLKSAQRDRAITILRWVAFAFRPLTIGEIIEAQAITDDCEDLPMDDIQEFLNERGIEEQILKDCGSLLEVRSNHSTSYKIRTAHLTHFTVKQYLVSYMPLPGAHLFSTGVPNQPDENRHSAALGRICLQYINFRSVWQQPVQTQPGMLQQSLRDYAAQSWYKHAAAEKPMDRSVIELINTFFDVNNANWVSWREWFDSSGWNRTPRESGSEGNSPLYYATLLEFPAAVEHLLHGVDQKQSNLGKGDALRAACSNGNREIMHLLLEAGIPTNSMDELGNSPANLASMTGHVEVIKLLLEKGADWTVANKDGCSPLYSASVRGYLEVVELLLEKGADWTVPNNDGWTPLFSASVKGHLKVVQLLLERGADYAISNKNGWTPLNGASSQGHLEVVRLLMENGADYAISNKNGWTPLYSASAKGYAEIVKLLLENGADYAISNKNGWTPLYSASRQGHTEVVKLLLEKDTDVSISTNTDQTPIHAAAFGGHSDVIQLLLPYGADMRVLDAFGRPPFFYAIRAGDPTSFSVLKVPEFLKPEFRDVYGSNALSVAVRCGHEEIIGDMISEHSLMVEDHFGRTPVWWAHKQGYMHMVEHTAVHSGPAGSLNLPTESPARFAAEDGYCDVCLASLEETYYICKICAGSFAMCLVCFDVGARCLVDTHILILSGR